MKAPALQTPAAPASIAEPAEMVMPHEMAGIAAVITPKAWASITTRSAGRPRLALPPKKSAAPQARQQKTASRMPTIPYLFLTAPAGNAEARQVAGGSDRFVPSPRFSWRKNRRLRDVLPGLEVQV